MNPVQLKDILGHSSLAMITNVYSHLAPEDAYAALRDRRERYFRTPQAQQRMTEQLRREVVFPLHKLEAPERPHGNDGCRRGDGCPRCLGLANPGLWHPSWESSKPASRSSRHREIG